MMGLSFESKQPNSWIQARLWNEKVKEIAQRLGLPCYDAYGLVDGRDDLKTDPYHYNSEGKELIASGICGAVRDEL